ncbi:MAG: fasciclin domain-containing protein [Bacteroidota bacterium]
MKFSNLFILLIAVLAIGFTACEEETPEVNDIVKIASDNPDFSILVDALTRADLVSTLQGVGPFTVLAPTNAAFTQLLSDLGISSLNDVDDATLTQILLNHVVAARVPAGALSNGYVSTLATEATSGNPVSLLVNIDSGVTFNGGVTVTTPNVIATNGIIHIIDKVITIPTVVDVALTNDNFSILVAALTDSRLSAKDYVTTLSGPGPFTIFAPTNAAFEALLAANSWSGLADIPEDLLAAVLEHHVIAGTNAVSTGLSDNQGISTLNGDITIKIDGSVKVTDGSGTDSNVTATDVQAGNGVIHVIDRVLIPAL